jgi:acyl dehydratase
MTGKLRTAPSRDLTDPRSERDGALTGAPGKEPLFENLQIPERFGPVTVLIDDHKVKRFAFTVNDYNPWHFGPSPFGSRIGHAGLLTNDLVQLFTLRYQASHVVGLHTEEQLWFDSPVQVGEQATLAGTYVESYVKRGLGYVVMEASASGQDGQSLVRHRGVEILQTMPGAVAGRNSTADAGTQGLVTGEVDETIPRLVKAGTGMIAGMSLAPLRQVVTQEQASVFSRCGEYVRNVHNDLDRARAAGLRVPIVQGQQQVCLLLALLTSVFGQAWFTSGWIRCKFIRPVEVFDEVTIGGVLTQVPTGPGDQEAELEVWVRREDGLLSTVGWASCKPGRHAACVTAEREEQTGPGGGARRREADGWR